MRFALSIMPPFAVAALLLSGCVSSSKQLTSRESELIQTNLAVMPEKVTSFGAVTTDGWLYVFGGHKGERHEYCAEMVSGSFHRLKLSDGSSWERLPDAAPGQGQPLVAYRGNIYRVGGMAARNPAGSTQDLVSTTLVQRFDPQRKRWEDVAQLPAPRSSHDAVVVGDKLYVLGGWQLNGSTRKAIWPATGLELDLSAPDAGWREISQPFRRRALAVAALGSRTFCIGGMDSDNQTTLAVDVYDTVTGRWTKGPDLPTGKNKGFGCSAIMQNGRIYASTFKGDLLRLHTDEKSWEVVGRLEHPRISHRLVTAGATQLIALGGEDGEDKRPELELLVPAATPVIVEQITPTKNTALPQ
jgi:N-acetylneuraminic acid mutarotase